MTNGTNGILLLILAQLMWTDGRESAKLLPVPWIDWTNCAMSILVAACGFWLIWRAP